MLHKNSGFTLVEVMVAMGIMLVGMLGLLQAINLSLEMNLRNQVRDEAVNIGERVMNELRAKGFDNISVAADMSKTVYKTYSVTGKIRGGTRKYAVGRSAQTLAKDTTFQQPTTKQLEVIITWEYRGVSYDNRVLAPVSILR